MKKPSIKKPNIKKPGFKKLKSGGQVFRNSAIGKYLATIIAVVMVLSCCGISYGMIKSKDVDHGYNEITVPNANRTEVFPQGNGYKLTEKQASQYQLPEKPPKPEKSPEIENGNNPSTSGGYNFSFSSGNRYSPSYRGISDAYKKAVTFYTDMQNDFKCKDGEDVEFYLIAKTMDKKTIDNKYITVKYGDEIIKGKKGKEDKYIYQFTASKYKDIVTIDAKKTSNNNARTSQYRIKVLNKPKEDKSYQVPVGSDLTSIIACEDFEFEFNFNSKPFETTEKSVTVRDVVNHMLGTQYKIKSEEDSYITAISGFDKKSVYVLTPGASSQFATYLGVDEEEFEPLDTGDKGTISNGSFHEGLGWVITDDGGKALSLSDKIDKKKATGITLTFGVIE